MDPTGTDITKVAGAYSTFAGVLAGFVFAVIGYLLATRSQEAHASRDHAQDSTLSWAVLAFVSLSLSSFLFALLSGEDRFNATASGASGTTRIRPFVLTIVASGVFTMAILVLLLALIWLFKREEINHVLVGQLRAVIWLTGLLVLFYFDGSFIAIPVAQGRSAVGPVTSLVFTGAIFVLAVVSGEVAAHFLRRATKRNVNVRGIVRVTTQSMFLVLVFACAGVFNILEDANEAGSGTWRVLDYEFWGLGALGVVLFLCVLNLPSWRPEGRIATNTLIS